MTATDEQHGQLDTGYPHTLRPELHKALMARGIDYWVAQGITFWKRDDGCECLAYGYVANGVPKLAIKVVGFTDPEQAIAATLGGQPARLTAEQVRDAVMLADRWEKPMGNTGLTNTHLIVRDDGWQAIADELNATLGSGTCRYVLKDGWYVCSNCGRSTRAFEGKGDPLSPPRFCPDCGAHVEVDG